MPKRHADRNGACGAIPSLCALGASVKDCAGFPRDARTQRLAFGLACDDGCVGEMLEKFA